MKVFICGAEALAVPVVDIDGNEIEDANSVRFHLVDRFLDFELIALYRAGQLTEIGYDPACQISCILERQSAGPVRLTQVAIANALASFAPDMIYAIGGAGQTVTIGGALVAKDVVAITATPTLGNPISASYTVASGDTPDLIVRGLKAEWDAAVGPRADTSASTEGNILALDFSSTIRRTPPAGAWTITGSVTGAGILTISGPNPVQQKQIDSLLIAAAATGVMVIDARNIG